MPINHGYHTWNMQIRQLRAEERNLSIRNFPWLIVGVHRSHSVYLSRIGGKTSAEGRRHTLAKRLSRIMAHTAINVHTWSASYCAY